MQPRSIAAPESVTPIDAIIAEHRRLIRAIAGQIFAALPPGSFVRYEDLVSAGTGGLLAAVDKYDAARNVTFTAYVRSRVRFAMLDCIRDSDPLKRRTRDRIAKVTATSARLHRQLEREPQTDEIAAATGLTVAQVLAARRSPVVSLECLLETDPDLMPAAPEPNPEQQAIEAECRAQIRSSVRELPARDQLLIELYYESGLTMKQIAPRLQVKESRVSQLHKAALEKLKTSITDSGISVAA